MPALNSSALASAEYDPWTHTLWITFRSGRTYTLHGVPEHHYRGLLHAASPGAYFNRHLRGRY
jgi:hypothetical protein